MREPIPELLTEFWLWEKEYALKHLLLRHPFAYAIACVLLAKKNDSQAEYFLEGYKGGLTVERHVEMIERTVEAMKISNSTKMFILENDLETLRGESHVREMTEREVRKFNQCEWQDIMSNISSYLNIPTLLSLLRFSIHRIPDLLAFLGFSAINELLNNVSHTEASIIYKGMASRLIWEHFFHSKITLLAKDCNHPRTVQHIRDYIGSTETSEKLSISEKMRFLGYKDFEVWEDEKGVDVPWDEEIRRTTEYLHKEIVDRTIGILFPQKSPFYFSAKVKL